MSARLRSPRAPAVRAPARRAGEPAPARAGRGEGAGAGHPLLALQRAAGNRAAGASVRGGLTLGRRGDPAEREAERTAGVVLGTTPAAASAHRGSARGGPLPPGAARGVAEARQGGSPLPASVRAFMEPRFGYDFGAVRVHTGARAAASARAVGAPAYAVGRDLVFGAGAWAPETAAGRRILAHELAHVVQQDGGEAEPVVRRYEGPEHQDLGDRYLGTLLAFLETEEGRVWAEKLGENRDQLVAQIRADPLRGGTIRVPHVEPATGQAQDQALTPGQVISLMGDFYESVGDLASAPPAEIRQILDVLERQRARTIAPTAADAQYERITGGRYLRLAARNAPHFAPRNRAMWRQLHVSAMDQARAAAENPPAFERALLVEAASGHFLTDAFASGHLVDYDQVMAAVTLHLARHPLVTANPQMQTYAGIVSFAGRMPQLVLKNLHDRLNAEGFEVTNARGMRWRTHGDDHLAQATETQRVAALAVFESRRQLYAASGGMKPDPAQVESLMPDDESVRRATQQAIDYIPEAVRAVEDLIYRGRQLAPTQFGTIPGSIIQSNLSTIGDPAREREIQEAIERAQRLRTGPVVVPSFTLGRF